MSADLQEGIRALSSGPQFALRFISGKYQWGEFPLKMDREIIIGRSSDLDMVLVEDMVSRKHAKISTHNGQVIIQDLGSTNGTFVNGEKIKRVRLREGDRILIGTSIIKLVTADGASAGAGVGRTVPPPPPPDLPGMPPTGLTVSAPGIGKRTSSSARSMAGTIDEIPLPDLLQLLSTSKKSGVLEIQGPAGLGRIYLRKGQIYFATIDDSFDLAPRKAVYRMMVWESGTFELQPPDDKAFLEELDEPTEGLLMEAMRQLDEIRRLGKELPPRNARLALAAPMTTPLRSLTPEQLDLVQAVHNHGQVSAILDKSSTPDLETYQALLALIRSGVLAAVEGGDKIAN
jgi:pSer/pThr/pTyr-binding forkhead associated (FHA) protein